MIAVALCALVARAAHGITDEEERAKAHFLAGQSYYEQASYADALKEFNEAYRLSKKPALLYNIARCHESLAQYPEAIKLLERYLRDQPDTSDRSAIETRIANLKARQAERKPVERAWPQRPTEPPPIVTSSPRSRATAPAARETAATTAPRHRVGTWVIGGIGVGLLAAALGTGVASQLDYNSLSTSCTDRRCDPATVANAQSRIDSGKRLAVATDVLWPVGTAAVATAVVLFFVEGRHPERHARWLPATEGSIVAFDR
jgi:tetratricopeptide (TPR) repeat protein